MPGRKSLLWDAVVSGGGHSRDSSLEGKRRKLFDHWGEHPWNWLAGQDTDGSPLILTTDPKDRVHPVKPFPRKSYLRQLVTLLHERRYIFVEKSRQMIVTTVVLLYIDWNCRFRDGRRWVVSRHKEDDAIELLRDKVRAVHGRLPEWVQEWSPMLPRPARQITYPNTGSYILATPQNVAESEARGGTASGVFIDEAPLQDNLRAIITASLPMCDKLFAVGTPAIGNPGARIMKMYIDEGKVVLEDAVQP